MKRAERNQVKLLAHSLRATRAMIDERIAPFSAAQYIRRDLADPLSLVETIANGLDAIADGDLESVAAQPHRCLSVECARSHEGAAR